MIFVVEDDPNIRELVTYTLQSTGFDACGFENGSEFLKALSDGEKPELVLLDIMLPGEDGISILRKLRTGPDTRKIPVIMLTARREEDDKIQGFEVGADDYVTKPFQLEEVVARINALVRRASGLASSLIQAPPYQLDLSRKELKINDEAVKLTAFEYQILEFLMRRSGEVISKDTLMFQLYADAELRETHTIDVLMGRLRRKMQLENQPDAIQTVRGQGYRFDMPT